MRRAYRKIDPQKYSQETQPWDQVKFPTSFLSFKNIVTRGFPVLSLPFLIKMIGTENFD